MSIILTKNDGSTDVTYLKAKDEGSKQTFVNASASTTEPESLMTDHQIKSGVGQSSRHTISIKKTIINTEGTQQGDIVASLVLTVPNNDSYTAAKLYDVVKQLQSAMKNAAVLQLVAGASLDGLDLNVTGPFVPA